MFDPQRPDPPPMTDQVDDEHPAPATVSQPDEPTVVPGPKATIFEARPGFQLIGLLNDNRTAEELVYLANDDRGWRINYRGQLWECVSHAADGRPQYVPFR